MYALGSYKILGNFASSANHLDCIFSNGNFGIQNIRNRTKYTAPRIATNNVAQI